MVLSQLWREVRDARDVREARDARDVRYAREEREVREVREVRDCFSSLPSFGLLYCRFRLLKIFLLRRAWRLMTERLPHCFSCISVSRGSISGFIV